MKKLITTLFSFGFALFSHAQSINSVLAQVKVASVSDVSSIELVLRTGGKDAKDINGIQFLITVVDENKKESVYKAKATEGKGGWSCSFKAPVASVYQLKVVSALSIDGYENTQDWGVQFQFGTGTRSSAGRANSKAELL